MDININKTHLIKILTKLECMICHYYFFIKHFRFQPKICDSCLNITQKFMKYILQMIVSVGKND